MSFNTGLAVSTPRPGQQLNPLANQIATGIINSGVDLGNISIPTQAISQNPSILPQAPIPQLPVSQTLDQAPIAELPFPPTTINPNQQFVAPSFTPTQEFMQQNVFPSTPAPDSAPLTGGQLTLAPGQQVPQTGLIGSEQALTGGLQQGLGLLDFGFSQGRGDLQNALALGLSALSPQGQGQGLNSFSPGSIVSSADGRSAFVVPGGGAASASSAPSSQAISQGIEALQPFAEPGQQAQQQQAALAGALGPDAQAAAIAAFNESPGQSFLRDRAEQALLRNQAAVGGLGGGNVLRELQRQGVGLAQQDFQNQFNRLGDVTGQGLSAASNIGQLRGQEAGIIGNIQASNAANQAALNRIRAGDVGANQRAAAALAGSIGTSLGGLGQAGGLQASQFALQTGRDLASGRTSAGQQIAGAIGDTTSGLSSLINQQGGQLSQLIGAGGSNLANILATAGQQEGASAESLAAILANISQGAGSGVAGLPALGSFVTPDQSQQTAGNLLSALGGLSSAFGNN